MKEKKPNQALILVMLCLLAGTLDALAAMLISYKVSPGIIFRFIASGWFGKAAFTGGNSMVLWGLFFHYIIASCWGIAWFLLYPAAIKIFRNKYVTGVIYGLVTWIIMNQVVLRLSNIPHSNKPINLVNLAEGIAALIFCIGIPAALIANRYYSKVRH